MEIPFSADASRRPGRQAMAPVPARLFWRRNASQEADHPAKWKQSNAGRCGDTVSHTTAPGFLWSSFRVMWRLARRQARPETSCRAAPAVFASTPISLRNEPSTLHELLSCPSSTGIQPSVVLRRDRRLGDAPYFFNDRDRPRRPTWRDSISTHRSVLAIERPQNFQKSGSKDARAKLLLRELPLFEDGL